MLLKRGGGLAGRQGLVKAVGVSNYGPQQLRKIHAYLTKRGVPLASVQVRSDLVAMMRSMGSLPVASCGRAMVLMSMRTWSRKFVCGCGLNYIKSYDMVCDCCPRI